MNVTISREAAIDAEAGCIQYAIKLRKEAMSRRNSGAHMKTHRAWLRSMADAQDAAARELRKAIDDAI
jgi:hypothetical protein